MRHWLTGLLLAAAVAGAEELRIKADAFEGDEKKGVSVFSGNVEIQMGADRLNAGMVTIFTDAERKPTKYVAEGAVTFYIRSENNATYEGNAQKAVFMPNESEYRFYKDVHLQQLDQKKQIDGDEVVVNIVEGKAYAKGAEKEPVIMIFDLGEKEEDK